MTSFQKGVTIAVWASVLPLMALVVVAALRAKELGQQNAGVELNEGSNALPVIEATPRFNLLDQDRKPFTDADLKGHVTLVEFVFTQCAGPCPAMMAKMAGLQHDLPDPRQRFLSITVDPAHDTPEVWKAKAKELHADESRWKFLTGDGVIKVANAMLVPAAPASADQPIMHSMKFLLFDASGNLRGAYNSYEEDAMQRMVNDDRTLLGQIPS